MARFCRRFSFLGSSKARSLAAVRQLFFLVLNIGSRAVGKWEPAFGFSTFPRFGSERGSFPPLSVRVASPAAPACINGPEGRAIPSCTASAASPWPRPPSARILYRSFSSLCECDPAPPSSSLLCDISPLPATTSASRRLPVIGWLVLSGPLAARIETHCRKPAGPIVV